MNLWTSGLPLAECLLWGWLLASVVFLSASWGLTLLLRHKSPALKSLIWVAGFTLTFLCGASMQLPGLIRLPVLPAASIKTPPLHSPTIAPVEIPTKAAAAFSLSTPARPIVHPANQAAAVHVTPESRSWRPGAVMVSVWLAGCSIFLFRILFGIVAAGLLITRLHPAKDSGPVSLALRRLHLPERLRVGIHSDITAPLSFGLGAGWVLFPPGAESWSVERLVLVLRHEAAHFRRHDGVTQLWARLVVSLCWMNPIAWWAVDEFRALCEMAADDETVRGADAPESYAGELLDLVRQLPESKSLSPLALQIGGRSSLRRRIASLLDTRADRRANGTRMKALSAVVVLLVAAVPTVQLVKAGGSGEKSLDASSSRAGQPMREVQILIRDEDGRPVANAEIQPNGLRAAFDWGSWYGWAPPAEYQNVRSDPQGVAKISFPEFTMEDVETKTVTASITHPDFCMESVEIDVGKPVPIVLQRGALIEISASPETKAALKICANITAANSNILPVNWLPSDDFRSVEARVPAGRYAIQAVGFATNGDTYFSTPKELTVSSGTNQSLQFEMVASKPLRGKISSNVPRPVSNGRIVAHFSTPVKGDDKLRCEWENWGPIDPDGSFDLRNCPPGEVQIIALCEGFVSSDPTGPQTGLSTHPQSFRSSDRDEIVVAMEPSGRATVTVLDPAGNPISGATVAFWPNQRLGAGSSLFAAGFDVGRYLRKEQLEKSSRKEFGRESPRWDATTDENGTAGIFGLPQGSQSFSVTVPGYEMPVEERIGLAQRIGRIKIVPGQMTHLTVTMEKKGTSSLREKMQNAESPRRGLPVRQQEKSEEPFAVSSADSIFSGRILDEQGTPLEGVLVDAWTWCPGSETTSDKNGRFELRDLERDRDIEVRFSKDGFSPIHITRQPLGTLQKDVVLSTRPYFEGRVVDSQGRPLANQLVRATCGEKQADGVSIGTVWTETHTDGNGHYLLRLWPDTYRVEVRSPDNEVVRVENQHLERGETHTLDLQLRTGVIFRARVIDAETGNPIHGVTLDNWDQPGVRGTSNENGEITIGGLFPGIFEFDVKAEDLGYRRWWSPQAIKDWEQRKIENSGWQRNFDSLEFSLSKNMEPVVIEMERGVTIRGVVRNPEGNPVAGATVAPARSGTGNSLTGDTRFSVKSGKDGRYQMLLPASNKVTYNLVVHDGAYMEWRRFANGVLPQIQTEPGQTLENIDIAVTRPCTVRGRVVDAQGRPVKFREVRAVSADMLENRYYFPTTLSGEDGTFTLSFVRAGKTYIQVAPFWLAPREAPGGTSVEINATENAPVEDVKLTASGQP